MEQNLAVLKGIAGVHELWRETIAGRDGRRVPKRVLLDTLGLGLEQTLAYLASTRPDFETFLRWIGDTAGRPDAARLDRYRAWYDGAPPPVEEVARQAAILAADPVFTPNELACWEREGVIVLRSAIDRHEAAAIAEHLWRTLDASPEDPESWYAPRTNGIMVQQFQNAAMEVPRRSRRIARGFAELYGHADLIASVDRLSFNPPERASYRFPGPHLHWDTSLAGPIPFETQGVLYLTDTRPDQGALQVVPGFHRELEAWLEARAGQDPRAFDLADRAVTIPASAGDLIIWRQEIPHGASANRSQRPRLAQYVNFHPMRWPDERRWL